MEWKTVLPEQARKFNAGKDNPVNRTLTVDDISAIMEDIPVVRE